MTARQQALAAAGVVTVIAIITGWEPPPPVNAAEVPTPISKATVDPVIPTEVVDGDGRPLPVEVMALPINFFDDFSWRTFLALNWPAVAGQRGVADRTKKVSDSGSRVWETWKADYELFQPGGRQPTEWASFDAVTPCIDIPFKGGGAKRVFGSFSKFGDFHQAGFGVPAGHLIAQNRTYLRYEVRVNRLEHDFIRDKELYQRGNLPKPKDPPLQFTPGSIEVKAAWRVLKPDEVEAAKARYYLTAGLVLNPLNKNQCEEKTLALIGFHIVQKTPLRPQWVWSSFEHLDNVPPMGVNPVPKGPFLLNDPTKPQELIPPDPPKPVGPGNLPVANPDPMQVVRMQPLHKQTVATNALYQKALSGTVWANYQLVVTEWPTKTRDPSKPFPEDIPGNPFPGATAEFNTANTSMETYFQEGVSCMTCHDVARGKKMDFVWFVHLRAHPLDEAAGKALGAAVESLRQEGKNKRKQ